MEIKYIRAHFMGSENTGRIVMKDLLKYCPMHRHLKVFSTTLLLGERWLQLNAFRSYALQEDSKDKTP